MTVTKHRIVALTGGIGSGKSTVARLFAERGARVIDADVLARRVVLPGQPALEQIRKLFGSAVITDEGSLNRSALAAIIFSDPAKRQALETILHPRIRDAFNQELATATTAKLTVYDVPLFFESQNPHSEISGVIVVFAPQELCITRIMQRDGISHEEALQRIRSQIPLEQKVARADWVIENSASLDALGPQVEKIYNELIKAC